MNEGRFLKLQPLKPVSPEEDPPSKPPRSRWRRALRWLRITLMALLFLLVVTGFYLNKAGLPEVVKRKIVATLKTKGWDVDFSRVRLRWHRGILIEDLQLHPSSRVQEAEARGPFLFIDEAQCRMDYRSLLQFNLTVDSLHMEGGRLIWPLTETNLPKMAVQMEAMRGDLAFLPKDRWQLSGLQAQCMGVDFEFNGSITNAAYMRQWKSRLPTRTSPRPRPEQLMVRWQRILNAVDQLKFTGFPEVRCDFHGDARDLATFRASLTVNAPEVESPWLSGTNLFLTTHLVPVGPFGEAFQAEVNLGVSQATTPWGTAGNIRFYLQGEPPMDETQWMPTNVYAALELNQVRSAWGQADLAVLTAKSTVHPTNRQGRLTEFELHSQNLLTTWGRAVQSRIAGTAAHPFQELLPIDYEGRIGLHGASTPWADVEGAQLQATAFIPKDHDLSQTNLAWPDRLKKLVWAFSGNVTNVHSPKMNLGWAELTNRWKSPKLELTLDGSVGDGPLAVAAQLDVATRRLDYEARSGVDPKGMVGLFTAKAQAWFDKYHWNAPPEASAQGHLVLPEWTLPTTNWLAAIKPTVVADGHFKIGYGAYRDVPFTSAQSSFTFSNLVYRMHDFNLTRPEGSLRGTYQSHTRDREFYWNLHSEINPTIAKSLLKGEKEKRALGFLSFREPPKIEAEVWGNWRDLKQVRVKADIDANQFKFKGEEILNLLTRLEYEPNHVRIYDPWLRRAANQIGQADGVYVDVQARKLYLTNAHGRLPPQLVAKVISDRALETLAPYQFEEPPEARVDGVIDIMRDRRDYDLRFDLKGGPFQWRMFRFDEIQGNLHWLGDSLIMTNMEGRLHEGEVFGHAKFDFIKDLGAQIQFLSRVTNVNFGAFTEQIAGRSNNLEGILHGRLVVSNAFSWDWSSWQGHGEVNLRDGLIWDIPMFGVFSPVLNTVVPGSGNSRAREATATYIITNSIIYTGDMDIHATMMHMLFQGTSDFERRIDGRMEAEVLKNVPGIGTVVSKILWPVTKLFDYKLAGTITEPKTEAVYIVPKLLFLPLNPIKGIRDIFFDSEADEADKPYSRPDQPSLPGKEPGKAPLGVPPKK